MDINIGIPALAQVEGTILRGGQPTAEGWDWLEKNGIKRVIKLNLESENSEHPAEGRGFELLSFPINFADQIIFRPDYNTVIEAVEAIQPNTFIHCTHGEDRTGLVVGAYRVLKQEWAKDTAWSEMLQHNFHPELMGLTLFWDWAV